MAHMTSANYIASTCLFKLSTKSYLDGDGSGIPGMKDMESEDTRTLLGGDGDYQFPKLTEGPHARQPVTVATVSCLGSPL